MIHKVWPVLAGLAVFAIAVAGLNLAARTFWPDYAAAYSTRAYDLPMLVLRLIAGAVAAVGAGETAAVVAKGNRLAVRWLGTALLAISVPWHVHIWNHYPVWYHLMWFGILLAFAILGSRQNSGLRSNQSA